MTDDKKLSMNMDPNWKNYQYSYPDPIEMPNKWQGLIVSWAQDYFPRPVFICQFELSDDIEVYMFGIRFEISKASVKNQDMLEGFFIEYLILELSHSRQLMHRLRQERSDVYSSLAEKNDSVPVEDLSDRRIDELSLNNIPVWEKKSARWPVYRGNPMFFVGQIDLVENNITKSLLTWDKSVFLFFSPSEDRNNFKITTQNLHEQTVEEHYGTE